MALQITKGNIFTSQAQTLVNPVNCMGVMGAGIALEFKFRYPDMYTRYQQLCADRRMRIGSLWLFRPEDERKWVLNLPTKLDWKRPSTLGYIRSGLDKFVATYERKGITSIAFPLLGADKGGIPPQTSEQVLREFLEPCPIPVEIYAYDAEAIDDLFLQFRESLSRFGDRRLADELKLRVDLVRKIRNAASDPRINSISRLASVPGIGLVSLEKVFAFLSNGDKRPVLGDQVSLQLG